MFSKRPILLNFILVFPFLLFGRQWVAKGESPRGAKVVSPQAVIVFAAGQRPEP
jgi:hypothetical protein